VQELLGPHILRKPPAAPFSKTKNRYNDCYHQQHGPHYAPSIYERVVGAVSRKRESERRADEKIRAECEVDPPWPIGPSRRIVIVGMLRGKIGGQRLVSIGTGPSPSQVRVEPI